MIAPDPLGRVPRIADSAWIAPTASVVGDVVLGDRSSVWFGSVLRGDEERIEIGAETNVQDGVVVHTTQGLCGVSVADGVVIGHGAMLHSCAVETAALIGIGARVLDLAVVGEDAIVAAGAVVAPATRVGRREMWAGVPARRVREVTAADLERQRWAVDAYVQRAAEYRTLLRAMPSDAQP